MMPRRFVNAVKYHMRWRLTDPVSLRNGSSYMRITLIPDERYTRNQPTSQQLALLKWYTALGQSLTGVSTGATARLSVGYWQAEVAYCVYLLCVPSRAGALSFRRHSRGIWVALDPSRAGEWRCGPHPQPLLRQAQEVSPAPGARPQ